MSVRHVYKLNEMSRLRKIRLKTMLLYMYSQYVRNVKLHIQTKLEVYRGTRRTGTLQ